MNAPTPPPLPDLIVEVENLRKSFGNLRAVNGVSFGVRKGSVVGFIGANGAGKTTTMRIMATLELPDSGDVRIHGLNATTHPREVRDVLGWMPDAYGTYKYMSVLDYLDFFARASGLRGSTRKSRLAEVMEFTNLDVIADLDMNALSKGMGQRLCLARTLLHDPELLILDEPAAGLDPKARIEFKNLVRLLATQGKTIFISSHILSELGEMCDSLVFIDAGRIVHQGTSESLKHHTSSALVITVSVLGPPLGLLQWADLAADVQIVSELPAGARISIPAAENPAEAMADCLTRILEAGIRVSSFHREERRLEDAFVDLLRKEHPQP